MRKIIFLCESDEDASTCPECDSPLKYRDSRIRILKKHGGSKSSILIRRLKCKHCGRLHNELPDILSPYKHYTTEVIEDVVDDVVDADDSFTENYPCEATMKRWKEWISRNVLLVDGHLKSVGYRILGFGERLLKSSSSLLNELRKAGAGWLGKALLIIYNSGGFLPS